MLNHVRRQDHLDNRLAHLEVLADCEARKQVALSIVHAHDVEARGGVHALEA